MRALTAQQVESKGLKVYDSKDNAKQWTSTDRKGKQSARTSIKLPGMRNTFTTDPGFNGNAWMQAHTSMTTLALEKAVNAYPRDAAHVIGQIFGRNEILQAFTGEYQKWARALDPGKTTGARYLLGALPEQAIAKLAKLEILLESAVVSVTDKQIAHALRDSKVAGLPPEVWYNLPAELAGAEAILLDQSKTIPALLYVLPTADGKQKIVVDVDYVIRERSRIGKPRETALTNMVITGRTITDVTVLKDPNYVRLWGKVR